MTNGSGCGSGRSQNIRIRIQIPIRKTGAFTSFFKNKKEVIKKLQTVEIKFFLTIFV
jgi:hypothetical protein